MNTYFIGQRVRIIGSFSYPQVVGTTGRIVGGLNEYYDDKSGRVWEGVIVHSDLFGGTVAPDGHIYVPSLSMLEPLVPDGMQPAQWEDCLWQPPKVEVKW